jgi:hypothetical protein
MTRFFKPNFRHLGLIAGAVAIQVVTPSLALADIVISSAPTNNVTCSSGTCTPTSSSAVLNVNDLQTLLASGSVKLAAAGEPVDVDIDAALSWVSTNTLTLDSYHSINVEQPVAVTGGGGLAIITNDGGSGGEFSFAPATNVAIWSLSSNLTINGTGYTLVDDIATLASDIAANPSGSYALAANYNAAPDGTYSASPVSTNFAGNFQGLGNTISNLTISNGAKNARLGLFAFSAESANISNVTLQNVTISGSANLSLLGAVVSINEGGMYGDHSSGTVVGATGSAVGGLTSANYGTILNSSSSAAVTSGPGSADGGLAGQNNGTISDCFATGQLTSAKAGAVGGLVGDVDDGGSISNSYATGSVSDKGKSYLGGLVGVFQGAAISTSYSTGAVSRTHSGDVGGFIGLYFTSSLSDNYWNKTTSGDKDGIGHMRKFPGITGLTSKKLRSGLPTGFDATIWAESPSINNGFPYLIANPPQ